MRRRAFHHTMSLCLMSSLGFGCAVEPTAVGEVDGGVGADAASAPGSDAEGIGEGPELRPIPVRRDAGPDALVEDLPPMFTPIDDLRVPVDLPVSFRVAAADPEGGVVEIIGAALPAGAALDPLTFTFLWTPSEAQLGDHAAVFSASDGVNAVEMTVHIHVFAPEDPEPEPGGPTEPPLECEGARVACGGICCEVDELCLFGACSPPGAACDQDDACGAGEYCEPLVGLCLPEGGGDGACQFIPPIGEFTPVVGCLWTPPEEHGAPDRRDVVMAPIVGNVNDDNDDGRTDLLDTPEIIFASYNLDDDGCCNTPGTIRVVSGWCNADGTMRTLASITHVDVDNSGGLALGDLTGDGVPEIVGILLTDGRPQGTVALRRASTDGSSWETLWRNEEIPRRRQQTNGGAQPSIADMDSDGQPDVIVGNAVLNGATGEVMWDAADTGGVGNNAFLGPISTVADIDLDDRHELLAGNTLYDAEGNILWTYAFPSQNSNCSGSLPCDGYSAIGNFDEDDEGEAVIVRRGEIFILEHTGELKWKVAIPKEDCADNESGPPTIADFDGDGRPEIGTAAADFYVVADPDCDRDPVPPGCDSAGILWKVPNQDCSSRATASSVFDFEADGRAEVVYADETTLRIFRGSDGAILFEDEAHGSHTRIEQPVVADVDNDGNAEVVIAGNGSRGGIPGVRVFQDAQDNWVRTRRIWNQHAYHVSNVSEGGAIPTLEAPNWLTPGLNNFRQNVQGDGVFNAPDIVARLTADAWECPAAFNLRVTAGNEGALAVAAGLSCTIYRGSEADEAPVALATLTTSGPLLVGGEAELVFRWEVPEGEGPYDLFVRCDDAGDGVGAHNECHEDNNAAALVGLLCEDPCPDGVERPSAEACNGVDDDCDGEVDEDLFRACEGPCGAGVERCEAGAWVECSAAKPSPEVCDLLDNDCDGEVDEITLEEDPCGGEGFCSLGACREPCQHSECLDGMICIDGYCYPPEDV